MDTWSLEDTVQRSTTIKANGGAMTEAQERHLEDVQDRVVVELSIKYPEGQETHGGNIWAKPGMMRQMRNEVLDQVVYSDVLEQQLREILALLREGQDIPAYQKLNALLNGKCD